MKTGIMTDVDFKILAKDLGFRKTILKFLSDECSRRIRIYAISDMLIKKSKNVLF